MSFSPISTPACFGVAHTAFGAVLIGWQDTGIGYLGFTDTPHSPEDDIKKHWPAHNYREDTAKANACIQAWLQRPDSFCPPLMPQGSLFQHKVWQALLSVPCGLTLSYSALALRAGLPATARRAVAHALACNPVSLLVPCHRVIRADGHLGGYRWGLERKQRLLAWEQQRMQPC